MASLLQYCTFEKQRLLYLHCISKNKLAMPGINAQHLAYNYWIASQANITIKRFSLGHFKVGVPGGFSYEAFNGISHIKPWTFINMLEASRIKMFLPDEKGQCFIDVDKLCLKEYLVFVMTSSMNVRNEIYDLNILKYPVSMDVKLSNIGKTSFDLQTEGYVSDFPEPLFFSQVKTVFVCSETKKPKSPPDWWFEKYAKEVYHETAQMERFSMDGMDENHSSESKVIVSASDVDSYFHSNWANYVRYCYNAYAERCISPGIAVDPTHLFRQVSNLFIMYKKETNVGDVLTTKVSPHVNEKNTFFFTISKDQDVACECKMKFNPL